MPTNPHPQPELLDVPAIEALTGLPRGTVRELVYCRRLPTVKLGRRVYVRRDALDAWIDANTRPARSAE